MCGLLWSLFIEGIYADVVCLKWKGLWYCPTFIEYPDIPQLSLEWQVINELYKVSCASAKSSRKKWLRGKKPYQLERHRLLLLFHKISMLQRQNVDPAAVFWWSGSELNTFLSTVSVLLLFVLLAVCTRSECIHQGPSSKLKLHWSNKPREEIHLQSG